MSRRRGFALLAVLWVLAALSVVAGPALGASRALVAASRNRIVLLRGQWAAEGCANAMLARLDSIARASRALPVRDSLSLELGGSRCRTDAVDAGSRLHRDSAGPVVTARLSILAGRRGLTSDSFMTDAGNGRVNLNSASVLVLASMPGVSLDLAERALGWRDAGSSFSRLAELTALANAFERDSISAAAAQLERLVGFSTVALLVSATGEVPGHRPTAQVSLVVELAGSRAAVTRRQEQ